MSLYHCNFVCTLPQKCLMSRFDKKLLFEHPSQQLEYFCGDYAAFRHIYHSLTVWNIADLFYRISTDLVLFSLYLQLEVEEDIDLSDVKLDDEL